MKLIFAPDSFKESLTALEICEILERVTARHFPDAETICIPVADGGEGTVDALLRAMDGRRIRTQVTGPLFEPETAQWGLLSDGVTAVMEMAQASGLSYVPLPQRDPRRTTSLGTGEMIAEALRQGVRKILIGMNERRKNECAPQNMNPCASSAWRHACFCWQAFFAKWITRFPRCPPPCAF